MWQSWFKCDGQTPMVARRWRWFGSPKSFEFAPGGWEIFRRHIVANNHTRLTTHLHITTNLFGITRCASDLAHEEAALTEGLSNQDLLSCFCISPLVFTYYSRARCDWRRCSAATQCTCTCNVCISSAFSITKPNVKIYTGDINKTWKCSELKIMAGNGEIHQGREISRW
jgi:hypothetical protein